MKKKLVENIKKLKKKKKNLNIKYFKLREILENESNHEEDLICKPLKREKKIEYENILNDYKKDYINAEFEKKKKKYQINMLLLNNVKKIYLNMNWQKKVMKL